ncbi:MAG: hypothetical protein ABF473_04395 [Bifidobacterium psychraerophilum]
MYEFIEGENAGMTGSLPALHPVGCGSVHTPSTGATRNKDCSKEE